MTLSRRTLLATASLIPLAACAGATADLSQVITDVGLIASGLQGALPSLVGSAGASVIAQITGWIADLQPIAAAIGGVTTVAGAQPLVTQIETILNSIVSLAATFTLPTPFGPALAAAAVLLPIIEAAVNLLVPAASAAVHRYATAMTPAQARAVLAQAAAGR